MSEFISGVITIIISFIMVLIVGHIFVLVFELDEHIKRLQKKIANVAEWKPKSGIDKEVSEEEKEIAELERQKEKMDRLEELERRKERLFKDVHGEELWECTVCGDEFETLQDYGRHISEVHHS